MFANRTALEEELETRRIGRLCHFTQLANVAGILREGAIYSRSSAESRRIEVHWNDPARFDNLRGFVCCSIQYPNPFLLDKFRKEDQTIDWAIFLLDPILITGLNVRFSPMNAAKATSRKEKGVRAFKGLYAKEVGGRPRGEQHHRACPTDLQAEVLVPDKILLGSVKALMVADDRSRTLVEESIERSRHEKVGFDVVVEPRLFDKGRVIGSVLGDGK